MEIILKPYFPNQSHYGVQNLPSMLICDIPYQTMIPLEIKSKMKSPKETLRYYKIIHNYFFSKDTFKI